MSNGAVGVPVAGGLAQSAGIPWRPAFQAAALKRWKRTRQAVAVRAVSDPRRQIQRAALKLFQGIQHRTIALCEKTLGNVHAIVRIDADQVGVERGMVDLG